MLLQSIPHNIVSSPSIHNVQGTVSGEETNTLGLHNKGPRHKNLPTELQAV